VSVDRPAIPIAGNALRLDGDDSAGPDDDMSIFPWEVRYIVDEVIVVGEPRDQLCRQAFAKASFTGGS
jgi:hypothetical protein